MICAVQTKIYPYLFILNRPNFIFGLLFAQLSVTYLRAQRSMCSSSEPMKRPFRVLLMLHFVDRHRKLRCFLVANAKQLWYPSNRNLLVLWHCDPYLHSRNLPKKREEKNQNKCQILIKNLQAYRVMKAFTIGARRVSPFHTHTLYACACFVDNIFFGF